MLSPQTIGDRVFPGSIRAGRIICCIRHSRSYNFHSRADRQGCAASASAFDEDKTPDSLRRRLYGIYYNFSNNCYRRLLSDSGSSDILGEDCRRSHNDRVCRLRIIQYKKPERG